MSFDIFVQDIPEGVTSIDDIPGDFVPGPIGRLERIRHAMRAVVRDLAFDESGWASIEDPAYSIEVNLGTDDPVESFAFHVRGDESGLFIVAEILDRLGLRAFAPGTKTGLFSLDGDLREAYRRWRAYRDQAVAPPQ